MVPGLPGPPICFGTERSTATEWSLASVRPLQPPVAVAVAVNSGLIDTPNEVSVAMWVRIRETDILLGADLEESGQTGRGWIAVLDSSERPQGRAAVFKVAHHGSITGHHDRIWTELLVDAPVAILTPWNRGSKLPTSADCSRIIDLTPNAYVTSHLRAPKKQTQEQAVARTLRESGIRVSYTEPDPGYVQLRRAHGAATWVVHLSPEARALAAAAH